MTTEILGLDELAPSQGNPDVTHNAALRQLEGRLVRALDKDLTVAPSTPANGDVYIVAASATGTWSGKDKKIAHFWGGGWKYYTPIEGNTLWVCDEDKRYVFDGTNWIAESSPLKPTVLSFFYPGSPTASALVALLAAPAGISTLDFAAAIAGSAGKALNAATAQTDFDVRKNATTNSSGTSVGTIRFAASGTVPTFIAASGFSLTGGSDYLTIWAPASPDATLANIGVSLYGTRNS